MIKTKSPKKKNFIKKNHNCESNVGYFLEVDNHYLEVLHNDWSFLPEIMKLEKVQKLVANFHDKDEYVIHIRNLNKHQVLDWFWKKIHRVIKFNQDTWLKPYIDMNTDPRKKSKYDSQKNFCKLINNVFGKKIKILRKHRDVKLVTTEGGSNQLVLNPNYHKMKIKKTEILKDKKLYLALSKDN